MLALGKHAKVSTVTFSSDLRLRGPKVKKGQIFKQCQMAKLNGANMLASGKTCKSVRGDFFLSDLWFRGQRSNLSKTVPFQYEGQIINKVKL